MHNEVPKIPFTFSSKLDITFLTELYDNDFEQAETVFETSLEQIQSELANAGDKFSQGDVLGLKKIIHKIKPLFGYVGLNKIITDFAAFEDVCAGANDISQTENGFKNIVKITEEALETINNELKRLKQYNTQCL